MNTLKMVVIAIRVTMYSKETLGSSFEMIHMQNTGKIIKRDLKQR